MNPARPFVKARSVNSNSANFPTWVTSELVADAAFTDPATAAGRVLTRLSQKNGNGVVPSFLQIFPYGLSADNDTFAVRIVGMRRVVPPLADGREQWFRFKLATLACTLGSGGGLAGGIVGATELFADTIAISYEGTYTADVTREGSIKLYSPADNTPAFALVALMGAEAIELEWDQTLNTPTMNALLTFLDGEY